MVFFCCCFQAALTVENASSCAPPVIDKLRNALKGLESEVAKVDGASVKRPRMEAPGRHEPTLAPKPLTVMCGFDWRSCPSRRPEVDVFPSRRDIEAIQRSMDGYIMAKCKALAWKNDKTMNAVAARLLLCLQKYLLRIIAGTMPYLCCTTDVDRAKTFAPTIRRAPSLVSAQSVLRRTNSTPDMKNVTLSCVVAAVKDVDPSLRTMQVVDRFLDEAARCPEDSKMAPALLTFLFPTKFSTKPVPKPTDFFSKETLESEDTWEFVLKSQFRGAGAAGAGGGRGRYYA